METNTLVTSLALSFIGSSGVAGLALYFFRRYIDKKLERKDAEAKIDQEIRQRRIEIERKMRHAYGRLFFWIYKYIETGEHNGDLASAYKELQEAEAAEKELDYKILSRYSDKE